VFLIALALFLFWLIALVARVRHGYEMWWLSVVSRAFCIMDVLMCGPLIWCYENRSLCSLCSEIFSACALCSGSHDFFVVYWILTYE
jgi:hypothetical protein